MDANIPAEKKKHDMKIVFTITIHKEEKWYVAKCLENGIASQGETMEGAMGNLREAVELYYEDAELPPFPQTYVTVMEVSL